MLAGLHTDRAPQGQDPENPVEIMHVFSLLLETFQFLKFLFLDLLVLNESSTLTTSCTVQT